MSSKGVVAKVYLYTRFEIKKQRFYFVECIKWTNFAT